MRCSPRFPKLIRLGGTGKTFIYCTLYHILRGHGLSVVMMASTGAAATLLPRGETVHRSAGLPVPLVSGSEANPKGRIRKRFEEAQVFIWDEVGSVYTKVYLRSFRHRCLRGMAWKLSTSVCEKSTYNLTFPSAESSSFWAATLGTGRAQKCAHWRL